MATMNGNHLTQKDVEEIRKFVEGKSRIEELISTVAQWPVVEPFQRFQPLDIEECKSLNIIKSLLEELLFHQNHLKECQLKSNQACQSFSSLDSGILDRIRKLTKAALEQNELSREDTDVFDVAIQALPARDHLARTLAYRQKQLDILALRLEWEQMRTNCWTTFARLQREDETFCKLSKRWSSTAASNQRHAEVAFLQNEVNQLAQRYHAFITIQVPETGSALDEIIKLQQVPDEFIEEQERLEDLEELIRARLSSFADLSRQWRWASKSDDLYRLLEKLNIEVKTPTKATDASSQNDDQSSSMLVESSILTYNLDRTKRPTSSESIASSAEQSSSIPSQQSAETLEDNELFVIPGTPISRKIVRSQSQLPTLQMSNDNLIEKQQRRVISDGGALQQLSRKPPSRIPTPSNSSRHASSASSSSPRKRNSNAPKSRNISSASTKSIRQQNLPHRQYRANPNSKLDVAIGKIVNEMPVAVAIRHASDEEVVHEPGQKSKLRSESIITVSSRSINNDDESGRYWIGHPDPKLCFCRILRSTVMVRVGGGWEELSSFMMKHFAHLTENGGEALTSSRHNSPRARKTSAANRRPDGLPWLNSASMSSFGSSRIPSGSLYAALMTPKRSSEIDGTPPQRQFSLIENEFSIAGNPFSKTMPFIKASSTASAPFSTPFPSTGNSSSSDVFNDGTTETPTRWKASHRFRAKSNVK